MFKENRLIGFTPEKDDFERKPEKKPAGVMLTDGNFIYDLNSTMNAYLICQIISSDIDPITTDINENVRDKVLDAVSRQKGHLDDFENLVIVDSSQPVLRVCVLKGEISAKINAILETMYDPKSTEIVNIDKIFSKRPKYQHPETMVSPARYSMNRLTQFNHMEYKCMGNLLSDSEQIGIETYVYRVGFRLSKGPKKEFQLEVLFEESKHMYFDGIFIEPSGRATHVRIMPGEDVVELFKHLVKTIVGEKQTLC